MNFTDLESVLLIAVAVLTFITLRTMNKMGELFRAAQVLHRVLSDVADGKATAYREKDGTLTAKSTNSKEKPNAPSIET